MEVFGFQRSRLAYAGDFVVCALALLGLVFSAAWDTPAPLRWEAALLLFVGATMWSLLEYLLHRYVLHKIEPFQSWHAAHHARPLALLGTPTWISASFIFLLVFLPVWQFGALWGACALTSGVLCGYLNYSYVHHAVHHWPARSAWGQRHKVWHARHHYAGASARVCFGVTSTVWDVVFGSAERLSTPSNPLH